MVTCPCYSGFLLIDNNLSRFKVNNNKRDIMIGQSFERVENIGKKKVAQFSHFSNRSIKSIP